MLKRTAIVSLLMLGLAGCASTTHPTPVNNLQIRVAQLESNLEKKDMELDGLKEDIKGLKQQIGAMEEYQMNEPADEYVEPKKVVESKTINSKDDTIRVSASPSQVQQALKNAGFYTGAIDGKIGAKTKQAIKDFQNKNNLKIDGVVGARTWDELKGYLK